MSGLYIFSASKMEAAPVLEIARTRAESMPPAGATRLKVGANELTSIVGGMGPRLARAAAAQAFGPWLEQTGSATTSGDKPQAILVIGLCGGLTHSVPELLVVAYSNCQSSEPMLPPLPCSSSITNRLAQLLNSRGITCECVVGITSARIAVRKADRLVLAASGASVVDMESYEILSVAARAGVPAAVLRVVSDAVDRELPDFNRALNAQGSLDGRKALRVAVGSPLQTLRLLAANKRAMRQLTEALTVVLPADWSTA